MPLPTPDATEAEAEAERINGVIRERLRALIALRGTSAQQVSLRATGSYGVVRDILAGKTKQPKVGTLERIAQVLHSDIAYLMGNHDYVEPEPPAMTQGEGAEETKKIISVPRRRSLLRYGVSRIPVLGVVEPGVFRSKPLDWETERMIEVIPPLWLQAHESLHFALEVDRAAFAVQVAAAAEGSKTYVLCARLEGQPIKDGSTYAILHRFEGGPAEVSVRTARVLADCIELVAFGACPEDRRVLRAGLDLNGDEANLISVIGVAYEINTILPLMTG